VHVTPEHAELLLVVVDGALLAERLAAADDRGARKVEETPVLGQLEALRVRLDDGVWFVLPHRDAVDDRLRVVGDPDAASGQCSHDEQAEKGAECVAATATRTLLRHGRVVVEELHPNLPALASKRIPVASRAAAREWGCRTAT